jgi:hypothetical protein
LAEFVSYITDVLGISWTVGTTTLTLGGIALGTIILSAGVRFFRQLSDPTEEEQDNLFGAGSKYDS